jgi:molybdate transport system substrate-binding protein
MTSRILATTLAALVVLGIFLVGCQSKPKAAEVRILAAAGLQESMTELEPQLDAELSPASVRIEFASSGSLLGKLKAESAPEYRADIYIPAEASFADDAKRLGLVDRVVPLAFQTPVLVVWNGCKADVRALADLARPDVKVALGEPVGPAIGKVSDKLLADTGLATVCAKADRRDTVQQVAQYVALGHADAGIIWDVVARQGNFREKLRVIAIPNAPRVPVLICRIANCPHPREADAAIRFLTTSAPARQCFAKFGFTLPEDGGTGNTGSPVSQPASRDDR